MDDLISRQDVLDILKNLAADRFTVQTWFQGYIEALFDVKKKVEELPAQPERKQGEWIDDSCSVCGQYVYFGDSRNFCPNCGADMRGDEHENQDRRNRNRS